MQWVSFCEMIITAQYRSPTVITSECILLNSVSTLWYYKRKLLVGVERTTPEHAQNDSSKIDLESFWSPSMSESWDNLNLYFSALFFQVTIVSEIHSCYECAISNGSRTLVHFETSLVTLITNHRVSGLCESNEGFSGRLESKLLSILPSFQVPPSWTCDCRLKTWRLDATACLSIRNTSQQNSTLSSHVLPCRRFKRWYLRSQLLNNSCGNSNILLQSSTRLLFGLHQRWVYVKYTWSKNDVGSSVRWQKRIGFFFFHPMEFVILVHSDST